MERTESKGHYRKWIKWASIFITSILLFLSTMVWLVYLPPNGMSVNSLPIHSAANLVALTFDDGPNPPYTDEILTLLDEHAVQATFFMTGKYVEVHSDCAKRVFAAGHEIANHGWDQQTLAFRSRETILESIAKTDRALSNVLGPTFIPAPYFRAPQGRQFLIVADVLRSQNRMHIGASLLGNDWLPRYQNDPSRIADRILNVVKAGDIIVLHDGNDHIDASYRQGTVEATRLILQGLKDRGLQPVSVGRLLGDVHPESFY